MNPCYNRCTEQHYEKGGLSFSSKLADKADSFKAHSPADSTYRMLRSDCTSYFCYEDSRLYDPAPEIHLHISSLLHRLYLMAGPKRLPLSTRHRRENKVHRPQLLPNSRATAKIHTPMISQTDHHLLNSTLRNQTI
jgi:hypothetical protein